MARPSRPRGKRDISPVDAPWATAGPPREVDRGTSRPRGGADVGPDLVETSTSGAPVRVAASDGAPAWRRWAAVAAGVAVLATAVVVARPDQPTLGTWGRADLPPDLVADRPLPAVDLALAWEHADDRVVADVVGPDLVSSTVLAEAAGVVAIGPLLVDVDEGRVVGRRPFGLSVGDGRVLLGDGATLETWDVTSGDLVDRTDVTGLLPGESLSTRFVFDDGDVLATVCCDAGRVRHVRVDADGEAAPLRFLDRAHPLGVHGERLVAVDRDGALVWVDADTGRQVSDPVAGRDDGGPLVDVGDHVVRAVGGRLVAVDTTGTVDGAVPALADGSLADLAVLGRVEDRLVVAGTVDRGTSRRQVVAVPLPPWSRTVVDATPVTSVRPPSPGIDGALLLPGAPPGIRRPGDAAVAGDVVVVHDVAEGRLRAVDLAGVERWTAPVPGTVAVAGVLDHVVVATRSERGSTTSLLSVADGAERWSGVLSSSAAVEPVVAVHDGSFVLASGRTLDARTGEVTADPAPFPGRPLGVVAVPETAGTAVLRVLPAGGRDLVRYGDREVELPHGDDGTVPEVRGLAGDTVIASRPVIDGDTVRGVLDLVAPGGSTTVADIDGMAVVRWGRIVDEPVVRRAGAAVLLDPDTGEDVVVVPDASGLDRAGDDRLVALGQLDWWVVDATDGDRVGGSVDLPLGQPVIGDGLVASTAIDGTISVVATDDGSLRWRGDGPPAPSTVAFVGDHLLVGTHDGRVLELDEGGVAVRSIEVGEGEVGALAWADGTLLVIVDGVHRGFRADGTGIAPDAVDVP